MACMLQEHRILFQKNATFLIRELYIDEQFLSVLLANNIITTSMESEIMAKPTPASKVREFSKLIVKRGPNAFASFIEACCETSQMHVAEHLDAQSTSAWRRAHPAGSQQSTESNMIQCAGGVNAATRTIVDEGSPFIDIDVLSANTAWAKQLMQNEDNYRMDSSPRGRCIIINNEIYQNPKLTRHGSDYDYVNIDRLFSKLGFETEEWKNVTKKQLMGKLEEEPLHASHSSSDSFVFVILSHGERGRIICVDEEKVDLETIFIRFDGNNCPALNGKPKIFLIQACQGEIKTHGVLCSDGVEEDAMAHDAQVVSGAAAEIPVPPPTVPQAVSSVPSMSQLIHEKSDFVLAYSTVPGYKSWRDTNEGTWFIRDLIYTFMERCHCEHLVEMLMAVNKKAQERGYVVKQIGENTNTCTRKIYFLPGYSK